MSDQIDWSKFQSKIIKVITDELSGSEWELLPYASLDGHVLTVKLSYHSDEIKVIFDLNPASQSSVTVFINDATLLGAISRYGVNITPSGWKTKWDFRPQNPVLVEVWYTRNGTYSMRLMTDCLVEYARVSSTLKEIVACETKIKHLTQSL